MRLGSYKTWGLWNNHNDGTSLQVSRPSFLALLLRLDGWIEANLIAALTRLASRPLVISDGRWAQQLGALGLVTKNLVQISADQQPGSDPILVSSLTFRHCISHSDSARWMIDFPPIWHSFLHGVGQSDGSADGESAWQHLRNLLSFYFLILFTVLLARAQHPGPCRTMSSSDSSNLASLE